MSAFFFSSMCCRVFSSTSSSRLLAYFSIICNMLSTMFTFLNQTIIVIEQNNDKAIADDESPIKQEAQPPQRNSASAAHVYLGCAMHRTLQNRRDCIWHSNDLIQEALAKNGFWHKTATQDQSTSFILQSVTGRQFQSGVGPLNSSYGVWAPDSGGALAWAVIFYTVLRLDLPDSRSGSCDPASSSTTSEEMWFMLACQLAC